MCAAHYIGYKSDGVIEWDLVLLGSKIGKIRCAARFPHDTLVEKFGLVVVAPVNNFQISSHSYAEQERSTSWYWNIALNCDPR